MREGKLTLPAIYALNSTQDADAFRLAIKVKSGEVTGDEIARLIEYTKQNGGIDYAKSTMMAYKDRAKDLIADIKNIAVRDALFCYLDYVVNRVK